MKSNLEEEIDKAIQKSLEIDIAEYCCNCSNINKLCDYCYFDDKIRGEPTMYNIEEENT